VTSGSTVPIYDPINLIGKTFFKQVKCFLGGNLVYDSSDKYAYRAFLETELNYGFDAKNSHLQASLYYKENGANVDTKNNEILKTRSFYFKDDAIVEITAPHHIDLSNIACLPGIVWQLAKNFLADCPPCWIICSNSPNVSFSPTQCKQTLALCQM